MFKLIKHAQCHEELKDLIAETRAEKNLETELPQENWDKMWKAITLATIIHEENFLKNKKPVSKNKNKSLQIFLIIK